MRCWTVATDQPIVGEHLRTAQAENIPSYCSELQGRDSNHNREQFEAVRTVVGRMVESHREVSPLYTASSEQNIVA